MSPFFFWVLLGFFEAVFLSSPKEKKNEKNRPRGFQVDPYIHRINDTERRHFAGMVTALDEGIGNVTNALEDREI